MFRFEKTGFETGFGNKIEFIKACKLDFWDFVIFPYHSIGITNEAYISKWWGLKKDSFRLMFYDFDSKILTSREYDKIIGAFTNDILLYESEKGYHFVSLCEDLDKDTTPEIKAKQLSKELDQDYYNNITLDYLTLRVIPKKDFKNKIHKNAPTFVKLIRKPKLNTRLSYEHLKIYIGLGIKKKIVRMYLKRCKLCKYKSRYFFYRCSQ